MYLKNKQSFKLENIIIPLGNIFTYLLNFLKPKFGFFTTQLFIYLSVSISSDKILFFAYIECAQITIVNIK